MGTSSSGSRVAPAAGPTVELTWPLWQTSRSPYSGAPRWSLRGPPRRSSHDPCSGALLRRWRDPALPCKRPARSGLRRWRHGAGRLSSGADVSGQGQRGSSVGRHGSPPPWWIRSLRPPSLPSPADLVNSDGGSSTGATDLASGERAGLLRIRCRSPHRRAASTPYTSRVASPFPSLSVSAASGPRAGTACEISHASWAGPARKSAHSAVPGPKARPVAL